MPSQETNRDAMTKALLDEPTNLVGMLIQAAREREAAARIPDCIDGAQQRLEQARNAVLVALRSSAPQEPVVDDDLRDEVIAAYIAGASEVHEWWAKALTDERADATRDSNPDFTEAAHDYAADRLQAKAPERDGPLSFATTSTMRRAPETGEE